MSESDHEDEQSQEHAPSPAEDRNSHVSEPSSPAYSNPDSATELKSPFDSKADLKRSRKSYTWIRRTANLELMNGNNHKLEEKANFSLKVSNLPVNWSFDVIKDVVFEHYGPVNYIHMAADDETCFVGMIKIEFVNFADCQRAWENLHGRKVDDIRLFAEMRDIDEESDDESTPAKKKRLNKAPWRPDLDIWDVDPKGLYGLTLEYLTSLGIKPPIDRWVTVTNIRCDKSELKEVMELAGQVLICTVEHTKQKIGRVMYSHPLEAVQAVSMLNNQFFYGQPLKLTIESRPVGTTFVPKGLVKIGPGLGTEGKPLRDIVKQYERYVKFQSSYVNPEIFRDPEFLFSSKADESEINIPHKLLKLRNDSKALRRYNLELDRSKSLSPNVRRKIEGPREDPERVCSPTSNRSIGQMGGSIPISKAGPVWGNGGPNSNSCGPGPMSKQGSMGGSMPISGPGPMGGPGMMGGPGTKGGLCPMGGPGNMGGPGAMGGPGPMCSPGNMGGPGAMGGPGPMCSPGNMGGSGAMGGSGPIRGPGPMGCSGPMGGPGNMGGPGFMGSPMNNQGHIRVKGLLDLISNNGAMGGPGPMGCGPTGGPGPMGGGPGPMGVGPMGVGPGPMGGGPGPMGGGPGPMGGGPGPMGGGPGPMGGGPGPMVGGPGPMSGEPIGAPGPMINPGPMGGPGSVSPGVAVELCNLPLSTTFPLLCEKMAECGKVMSLQLTSPGCAVVQFAQRIGAESCFICEKMAECGKVMSLQLTSPGCAVVQFAQRIGAESCFRQYNGRHILGNVIEVKYL